MKFFEVRLVVGVRETLPSSSDETEFGECVLTVCVPMGDGATPRDAVEALARKLEKLCDDPPPYEGD